MTALPSTPPQPLDDKEITALRESARRHLLHYGRDFSDIVVTKASGARIYDERGRAIIDFSSGQMCATLGHNHPAMVAAIERACGESIHLDSTKLSPAVIELAESLCALLPPSLQKVQFLSTGGESNEAALRLAKLATGRFEVAAYSNSWHGTTGGAASSTYNSGRKGYGPPVPGTFMLPAPNAFRCPIRHCRERCDKTCLEVGFAQFDTWSVGAGAAVIAEPVQSAGGMVVPPDGYLTRLKELCRERGMLLIFDEAQTGLGRIGANFAFEAEGVVPDILTLSKTLGAGVPLSAVVTSDAIAEDTHRKNFSFYTSHSNDPLPARVGQAVLGVLVSERLADVAREKGQRIRDGLEQLKQRYEVVGDVRGRGMLLGVELVEDRHGRKPALDLIRRATARALELGLNVNKAGGDYAVWRIAPPITIDQADIDHGLEVLDAALRDSGAH